MTDDDLILDPDHEPTKDEVIARAQAQIEELNALRADYDRLTDDEKAAMPEIVRRFFGK